MTEPLPDIPCSPSRALRPRRERGFSLIEVIIAMTILSVVLSGAAMAVVSSDSVQVQTAAVADSHAIAQKAVERLQTDLTARGQCDQAGWKATVKSAKLAGTSSAPSFSTCLVEYDDMRDPKGRRYLVDLTVQPIDSPDDGVGSKDTDGNLRDRYELVTSVELAADSKAGRETAKPIVVAGSVDWKGGSTDAATIDIVACGVDRKDWSLVAGGCAVGDPSRLPLPITVSLRRQSEETGALAACPTGCFSASSGGAPGAIDPGAYQVVAPSTFAQDGSTYTLLKIDPQELTVAGSTHYTIHATYVRGASTVNVCTQIANWNGPYDDGYEVSATNLHYRRTGSGAYRTDRIGVNANRTWNCSTVLKDTVDVASNLYRGLYDAEIEQAWSASLGASMWGLRVDDVKWDCTGVAWNQPLNGTDVFDPRTVDPTLDRNASADNNPAPSRYIRFKLDSGGSHRLCIRFYDRQFTRVSCTQNTNGTWPAGCFKVGTACIQYCPSGARVCFQNCSRSTAGAGGWIMQAQTAKPFGGPADPTVGCRPRAQGGYQWYGWKPSVILEGVVGQQATQAQFSNYEWVGGQQYYYDNFSGHYGSGPVYYCEDVSFAASWQYLCKQGSNTPVYAPGFITCRYHYGDCIQAELQGFPGVFVRGYMRDVSVNYTKPIIPSINALRSLAYLNGMNRPSLSNGWDPGTWWNSLDMKIAKVGSSYSCNWDYNTGKGYRWEAPVIVDVYQRIVNRADLFNPTNRAGLGNLASDKAGV